MKILHFNSTLKTSSGVMSVIMNYYRNINRDNIQFDFLYFYDSDSSYEEEIKNLGGVCYKIPNPSHYFTFKKSLKEFLDNHSNEYDILHIHDWIFATMIYSIAKKYKNLKIIIHSHATSFSDKKIASIRNRLMCLNINKCCDYRFACSKAAGDFLYKNNPYYVANNAIDVEKFKYNELIRESIRKEMKIKNDTIVVGHVGAFNNQKNHLFLLKVFNKLLNINYNAVLVLIGDGELKDNIIRKAKELNIDKNIYFLGKKKNVNDYYQAMDVFVMPSLFEGLPMVSLEAQCSGLPIVLSTNISSEAGLVNYKFISLEDSPEKWAEEIILLYKKYKNYNRYKGMDIVSSKGFNIKKEATNLEQEYKMIKEG